MGESDLEFPAAQALFIDGINNLVPLQQRGAGIVAVPEAQYKGILIQLCHLSLPVYPVTQPRQQGHGGKDHEQPFKQDRFFFRRDGAL